MAIIEGHCISFDLDVLFLIILPFLSIFDRKPSRLVIRQMQHSEHGHESIQGDLVDGLVFFHEIRFPNCLIVVGHERPRNPLEDHKCRNEQVEGEREAATKRCPMSLITSEE